MHKRNAHGLPQSRSFIDEKFKYAIENLPVKIILGVHVRGSRDRAVQKSILRHHKINFRSLTSIA